MLCLRAWGELGTCRAIGMDLGPIPITAIWQWCAVEGLDREAAAVVRDVIRHADAEFLARRASARRLGNITGG